jgi:hypothetical protein
MARKKATAPRRLTEDSPFSVFVCSTSDDLRGQFICDVQLARAAVRRSLPLTRTITAYGTGKLHLLRARYAAAIRDIARRDCEFQQANDSFTQIGQWRLEEQWKRYSAGEWKY